MGTVEPKGTTMKQALLGFVLLALASAQEEEVDPIEALSEAIPGSPGEDYPIYATPPETSFGCDGYIEGYYADPEAECQAFHICANFGDDNLVKYSFLCPNGTLFNQQYFICDWWFNVDCSQAEDLYGLNERWQRLRQLQQPQQQVTPTGQAVRRSPPIQHLGPIAPAGFLPQEYNHQSHRGLVEEG